ncbi:helix-turn-helix protein [Alkalispirillum mobile]|uniref:Helix-turn-helix protein n=1 Tax=Alkalispirillum mobile TaxID=85925 RepID=A0A498BTE0_9GAMM|nr:helix-turn-helix domain-containing protein [Alkalispirillum mobile]RLK46199.1 helix-turn-helix protein [Alkalispirillum mobile]
MTDTQRLDNPIYRARRRAGLTLEEAAEWLGIHPGTLYRQETGRHRVSGPVLRALELRAGDLAQMHPAWEGWEIRPDGRLYDQALSARMARTPAELRTIWLELQLLAEHRRQIRELQNHKRTTIKQLMHRILALLGRSK